jgi:hypothetical protein
LRYRLIFIISQQMNFIKHRSLGFNGNAVIEVNFNGDQQVVDRYASIKNELLKNAVIGVSAAMMQISLVVWEMDGQPQKPEGKISTSIYR